MINELMKISKSDIIFEYQTNTKYIPDEEKAYFGGAIGTTGIKGQMSSYIDGYREAIDAIYIRFLTEAKLGHIWVQDTIVFPLIYNHRHCIELELKRFFCLTAGKFNQLAKFHTHKLSDLWGQLKNFIMERASRIGFNLDVDAIDHYVSTLDSYDEKSIRFRYPMDTTLNSTNPSLELINVRTFHMQLNIFHDTMDFIYHSLVDQVDEWRLDKDFKRKFLYCLRNNLEDLKVALSYEYPKLKYPNKVWLSMSEIPQLGEEEQEREYRYCQCISHDIKEIIMILYGSLNKYKINRIAKSNDERLKDLLRICNDTYSNENIFSFENLDKAFWEDFNKIITCKEEIISFSEEILFLYKLSKSLCP